MSSELLAEARARLPETIALRRQIHRHPELGNDLPETRRAVLEAIDGLDLAVHLSNRTSGVLAVLESGRPGRTLLLRGDMDALPMPENTDLEFASEVSGRMHACGHDAHTAMLAGAAHLLSARRERLQGRVCFMFQPGEEGPGGAVPMMEEGLLETAGKPDAAFALHIYPNLPAGRIACRAGAVLAAADQAFVRIIGRGGHGSMPYDALDPVPIACEIVTALQTFVTRRIRPFDPVVITAGRIQAGTVNNVIPEHAEIDLTVRSFSERSRTAAHAGVRRIAEQIAAAHEARAEVRIQDGYPATVNDPDFAAFVADSARALLGDEGYHAMPEPLPGAEDFSYVLQRYPGAFAFLGVAPPGTEPSCAAPCHSNRMVLDEQALAVGVATHAAVAQRFLGGE